MEHNCPTRVEVRTQDFDMQMEADLLAHASQNTGAIVTFSGLCRDEKGTLAALELEHYPGMAEAKITDCARAAALRWPLLSICVIHRYGLIKPGENIVFVGCSSSHRQAAFDGASYIMDYLKSTAPFWKKEHLKDGTSGKWVDAKSSDDDALDKWK